MKRSINYVEWFFLVTISYLFVAPQLFHEGMNIVLKSYEFGATSLWDGQNPYAEPYYSDWYKYSPFFAIIFFPFNFLSSRSLALSWALINIGVFWYGIERWFSLSKKWYLWFGFLWCAIELNISVRYQQINALLIGLSLIGIAEWSERKLFFSAILLVIATNIKVLSIIFLLFCFRLNKKFIIGLIVASLFTFLLPLIRVGFNKNILFHVEWIKLLMNDMVNRRLFDISSVFLKLGWSFGLYLKLFIIVISIVILLLDRVIYRFPHYDILIPVGASLVLLINPRTESPTFVFAIPMVLFILNNVSELSLKWQIPFSMILIIVFLVMSLSFTDIWPKKLFLPHYEGKTLSVLVLWLLSVILAIRTILGEKKCPQKI